jgi:epoxyqueuosine reductase
MRNKSDTDWITERARAIGFDLCGVAPAERYAELQHLPDWLRRGFAGEMAYLADPRREDPARVLPGVRSVIVCALNYNTQQPASIHVPAVSTEEEPRGWISRYAWGDDYHDVLGAKLTGLAAALREHFPEPFEARWYVDTGPVHERVFAHHAGLGWLGKNTLLINEQLGSFLFLGVILTTLDLAPSGRRDEAPPDLCGSCRLCLEACPTGALVEPYVMDARRCISYLTIELRGPVPEELRAPMGRHVFGCDICQDVCPWNRRAPAARVDGFRPCAVSRAATPGGSREEPDEPLFHPRLDWLASLSSEEFRRDFRGSPIRRAKWAGLLRNACIALGNSAARVGPSAHKRIATLLERLSASPDATVAECAGWALRRLSGQENRFGETDGRTTGV